MLNTLNWRKKYLYVIFRCFWRIIWERKVGKYFLNFFTETDRYVWIVSEFKFNPISTTHSASEKYLSIFHIIKSLHAVCVIREICCVRHVPAEKTYFFFFRSSYCISV